MLAVLGLLSRCKQAADTVEQRSRERNAGVRKARRKGTGWMNEGGEG